MERACEAAADKDEAAAVLPPQPSAPAAANILDNVDHLLHRFSDHFSVVEQDPDDGAAAAYGRCRDLLSVRVGDDSFCLSD